MEISVQDKIALLRMEFPALSLDSDPDIERYFELRSSGRQREALDLYNSVIRRKFPDETGRVLLLRYYRARDPRYQALLRQYIVQLADKFTANAQNNILYLTRGVERLDMNDAYSVIKTAEHIIGVLGRDRYRAVAAAEKYVSLARKLDFRAELMQKTADLLRQYVNDSVDSVSELKRSYEQKQAQDKADARESPKKSLFDLSRISFSKSDLARIEISPSITKTEDRVLAFCLKYYPLVQDAAFERAVFLYSKKYGTKHYDVFRTIKIGRLRKSRDSDILTAVLGTLIDGYFYSVQGDRYLQLMWRRLRSQGNTGELEGSGGEAQNTDGVQAESAKAAAKTAKAVKTDDKNEKDDKDAAKRKKNAVQKETQKPDERQAKQASESERTDARAANKDARTARGESAQEAVKNGAPKTAKTPQTRTAAQAANESERQNSAQKAPNAAAMEPNAAAKPKAPRKKADADRTARSIRESAVIRQNDLTKRRKIILNNAEYKNEESADDSMPRITSGSVSDIIKRISGSSYDVYKDLFFAGIRPFIRKELARDRTSPAQLFSNKQNKAEELVYEFLEENYDNPFMQWENSESKNAAARIGYDIESLTPLINEWCKSQFSK